MGLSCAKVRLCQSESYPQSALYLNWLFNLNYFTRACCSWYIFIHHTFNLILTSRSTTWLGPCCWCLFWSAQKPLPALNLTSPARWKTPTWHTIMEMPMQSTLWRSVQKGHFCHQKCSDDAPCDAWTLNTNNVWCGLKTKDTVKVVEARKFVSGSKLGFGRFGTNYCWILA